MYDKDMFQTVPFRLNLNHDEDALVWKLLLSIDEEPRKSCLEIEASLLNGF